MTNPEEMIGRKDMSGWRRMSGTTASAPGLWS
jgi:hypothetical protein